MNITIRDEVLWILLGVVIGLLISATISHLDLEGSHHGAEGESHHSGEKHE